MSLTVWKTLLTGCLAFVFVLGLTGRGQTVEPADVLFIAEVSADDEAASAEDADKETADKEKAEYWLGLSLDGHLPDLLKAQLGIESGLVVSGVAKDSPAAKAEVKKNDILLKVDATALNEPQEIIKLVEASGGKEITLTLLRGGKEITIKASPVKRPEEDRSYRLRVPSKFDAEIKGLEKALESLKGKAGDEALGLFFARPGVLAPRVEVVKRNELPKNMTIDINKEGNKPAKIRVKKDNQEWEITEDKLGDLPEDVRTQVQQFLSRPMRLSVDTKGPAVVAKRINVKPDGKVEVDGLIEAELKLTPSPSGAARTGNRTLNWRSAERDEGAGNLEAKLDTVLKKLEQLSKEVEEIRSKK